MSAWLHPALPFLLTAALVPLLRGRARAALLLGAPLLALAEVALNPGGAAGAYSFLGAEGLLLRADRLALLFGWIFTLMAFLGNLYALHVEEAGHHAAAALYVGSSLGAVFAGDYLTLFVCWEAMALSSVFLIWLRRGEKALGAGFRYLLMHLFGGILLLVGIALRGAAGGGLAFNAVAPGQAGVAEWLILAGFALNAAVVPLHTWLTDAYPEATVAGAVFLCAFTTKTAVYVLARGFAGHEILAVMGTLMTIYGVFYAVIENDIRRVLAYHIVSQVGYMVAGIGVGTEMAVNGACAHAFAHILYKALLFMGAGSVLMMAGTTRMTRLGGLWRTMPLTMLCYVVGAVSISGVPFFSGFVSKSMTVAAVHEAGRPWLLLGLQLAGVGTFLSVGLKVTWFAFLERGRGVAAAEPPAHMRWSMLLTSGLCLLLGLWPGLLYRLLPFPVEYHPYSAGHLSEMLSILTFTAVVFVLLLRKLAPEEVVNLDVDALYRGAAAGVAAFSRRLLGPLDAFWGDLWKRAALPGLLGAGAGADRADRVVVDGTVDGVALGVRDFGALVRRLQNGQIQAYIGVALMVFAALLIILLQVP